MAIGRTYQDDRSLITFHGEAVDVLRLKIASDGCPNPGGDLVARGRLVGHPACLEVMRQNAGTHLVHPQRSRHQQEYPSVVDNREDERGGQTFLAQLLQGVEDGAELRLKDLDDAIVPMVCTLRDQAPSVVGEEVIVVSQIEPLGVPPGVVRVSPTGMYSRGSSALPVFCTKLRQPARTGFLTPVAPLGRGRARPGTDGATDPSAE